jgi:hypothetical protein
MFGDLLHLHVRYGQDSGGTWATLAYGMISVNVVVCAVITRKDGLLYLFYKEIICSY